MVLNEKEAGLKSVVPKFEHADGCLTMPGSVADSTSQVAEHREADSGVTSTRRVALIACKAAARGMTAHGTTALGVGHMAPNYSSHNYQTLRQAS